MKKYSRDFFEIEMLGITVVKGKPALSIGIVIRGTEARVCSGMLCFIYPISSNIST